jgi:hypothetical protein
VKKKREKKKRGNGEKEERKKNKEREKRASMSVKNEKLLIARVLGKKFVGTGVFLIPLEHDLE